MPAGRSARCATAGSASPTRTARWSISTSATLKGNFAWQITRAFHLAGRCVGCDECTRVCPAGIDLRLLNLSLAKAAEENFGYRAGMDLAAEPIDRRLLRTGPRGVHPMSEVLTEYGAPPAGRWLDCRRQARCRAAARAVPTATPSANWSNMAGWTRPSSCCLTGFIRPANSIKEFVFPRHEKLYGYRFAGEADRTDGRGNAGGRADHRRGPAVRRGRAADPRSRVQLGSSRRFYNRRRELTTVVTLGLPRTRRPLLLHFGRLGAGRHPRRGRLFCRSMGDDRTRCVA